MKKIVFWLIIFMWIGWGWGQQVQTPSIWPMTEEESFANDYCSSKYTTPTDIQACASCITNGMIDWGQSCVPIQQLCSDAYANTIDQVKCNDKYTTCSSSWGSVDRCACKAIWGISLNTNVPFVGNCISLRSSSSSNTTQVTPTTAFPRLLSWLTKIVMTVILIFCFMAIIVGWVLISMGWASEEQAKKGKDLIKHVVMALALLGASGVILRVINPSFFG